MPNMGSSLWELSIPFWDIKNKGKKGQQTGILIKQLRVKIKSCRLHLPKGIHMASKAIKLHNTLSRFSVPFLKWDFIPSLFLSLFSSYFTNFSVNLVDFLLKKYYSSFFSSLCMSHQLKKTPRFYTLTWWYHPISYRDV